MTAVAVLLAAGLGTRMKSALPKALHRIAGPAHAEPPDRELRGGVRPGRRRGRAGHGGGGRGRRAASCVVQQERLGTAHAALQAEAHFGDGDVAVLYADNPLIRPETHAPPARSAAERRAWRCWRCGRRARPLRPGDPARRRASQRDRRMGRRDGGGAGRDRCATPACSAPRPPTSRAGCTRSQPSPAKGEYYLTDCVALAVAEGKRVAAVEAP